jgi:hypothetical protein
LSHQCVSAVVRETTVKEINIRAEVATVQAELLFLRERVLPALFGTPLNAVFDGDYADWVREKSNGRLSEWQEATRRLTELLPLGPSAPNSAKISRDDFKEFLFQDATPSYCVREGSILWQIRLFVDPSVCSAYFPSLDPTAFENLSKLQCWLMSLPVDSTELANALCMVLPLVADADPAIVKFALDTETWRNILLAGRDNTVEEQPKRLKWIDGLGFAHWLNNSLLHVLGALANNHFMLIEDFLDQPFLIGGYTHLMPHYLFAVLFEKVAILQTLSTERPDLW